MRVYKVKVNNKTYEVKILSVTETEPLEVKAVKASAPAPKAEAPVAEKKVATSTTGVEVKSPMQGTILDVKVKVGDSVKKGATLMILEAMKLENEITATQDGTIKEVCVSKGASVNTGDVLAIFG